MNQNIFSSELDPNLVSPGGTVKFCDNSNTYIGEKVKIGNTGNIKFLNEELNACLLYTSPSPRDRTRSRMPSSA